MGYIFCSTKPVQSEAFCFSPGSALVPFLESRLRADSFLEICSHTSVYKCVVNIIREIGTCSASLSEDILPRLPLNFTT